MNTINIKYVFTLPDGKEEVFDICLNPETLDLIGNEPKVLADWVRLDYLQCPNCPFTPETHQTCPLVMNLVNIILCFEKIISYEEIHVAVHTDGRIISKDTTAQRGISSLMGLVNATSGCPHTAFFKPMAHFHLPFATQEETMFRATSTYLMTQYFLKKEGKEADLNLQGLSEKYKNVQVVNKAIVERLRETSESDSSLNAIIILDMLAQVMPDAIEDSLEKIRYIFKSLL